MSLLLPMVFQLRICGDKTLQSIKTESVLREKIQKKTTCNSVRVLNNIHKFTHTLNSWVFIELHIVTTSVISSTKPLRRQLSSVIRPSEGCCLVGFIWFKAWICSGPSLLPNLRYSLTEFESCMQRQKDQTISFRNGGDEWAFGRLQWASTSDTVNGPAAHTREVICWARKRQDEGAPTRGSVNQVHQPQIVCSGSVFSSLRAPHKRFVWRGQGQALVGTPGSGGAYRILQQQSGPTDFRGMDHGLWVWTQGSFLHLFRSSQLD
jgi:hypothetical protein